MQHYSDHSLDPALLYANNNIKSLSHKLKADTMQYTLASFIWLYFYIDTIKAFFIDLKFIPSYSVKL